MRRYGSTILLLFLSTLLFAQPANDDCDGIIDLGIAPFCPTDIFFTNLDATASDIGFGNIPACFNGGNVDRDVWFTFTTSDTIFDYTITVNGLAEGTENALTNPQIALYRGECQVDGLAELLCVSADPGENIVELDALGLTPNVQYFIRVNDFSSTGSSNAGSFQLCVDELQPVNNIDEGGSTSCFGELYDSGGPDGDYGNNENHVFTICPSEPHNCITFSLEYYNIEISEFYPTDEIIFYDGNGTNPTTIIGQIGGADFGLGQIGGGGVCYQVQASSGCLTVEFKSDPTVSLEGFGGYWNCSAMECETNEAISVENWVTEEEIVDFISTPSTVVEVTNIECPDNAYGIFEATDNSDLGLGRGILLTTGALDWAIGPNNDAGGGNFDAENMAPGDLDLDYLSITQGNGDLSNDACVLELDVLANTSELVFEYVFGSEEYPEFVNEFNDIFAFFISGPGIVGDPNIDNQLNIAVLPEDNSTPVEINSVNNLLNWEYYRDNTDGQSVQYDGLTSDKFGIKKSLTARAQVTPCSTYHLKLAIADRLDFVWDSGVFISEIRGGTPNLSVRFNSGVDFLIEDCTNVADELVIELSSPLNQATSYNVVIGGTAVQGIDYELNIPAVITFEAGETLQAFDLSALSDLEVEDTETIIISLVNDLGCGEVVFATTEIELRDKLAVEIQPGQDTIRLCQDSTAILSATGATTYFWTPIALFENPSSPTPTITPTESTWVFVEGNVGSCNDRDSVFLELFTPDIEIEALDPTAICEGDSVRLALVDNSDNPNISWDPNAGLTDPSSPIQTVQPIGTTIYTASVDVFGCMISDTITIDVDPFDLPELIGDTTICQNYPVQLATANFDSTVTRFSWTPIDGLDNPNSPTPIAFPDQTTTYELIATSVNEACADTSSVIITVLPADVELEPADTLEICLGDQVNITAITNTGSDEGLHWFPLDGSLSDSVGLELIASPTISTSYYATFEIGSCTVTDSLHIRVDSLPDLSLTADPFKDPYCPGETVTISSPTYEPGYFEDIEHLWINSPGIQSGDSLWNLVFISTDSSLYQRVSTNRGCIDTASIQINVIIPPLLTILPTDTITCPGSSVDLQVTAADPMILEQLEELMWMPESGLSCTECLDPTASPIQTTNYDFSAQFMGCPTGASTTITVGDNPPYGFPADNIICAGESILLNNIVDINATYSWTSTDPNFIEQVNAVLVVSPTETATYFLSAGYADCPPIEDQITIEVIPEATLELGDIPTILCQGEPVSLLASANVPGTYSWVGSNGFLGEGENVTDTPLEATTYTLTFISSGACDTLEAVASVAVEPVDELSPISTDPEETPVPQGAIVELSTQLSPGFASTTINWTANGQPVPGGDALGISQQLLEETIFQVTATTPAGCESSQTITIGVVEPEFGEPSVFSPDGDGTNDFFNITTMGAIDQITNFKVYNRWGQVVYDNDNPDQGWDGTYNGNPQPMDVYIYKVSIRLLSGVEKTFEGDITLIR